MPNRSKDSIESFDKKGNLCITRRRNQSIKLILNDEVDANTPVGNVFDEIIITVGDITGPNAKILIEANQNIDIVRTELIKD